MAAKEQKPHEAEKRLQIFFGLAIAFVVIGLIAFVVLVVKDMQH